MNDETDEFLDIFENEIAYIEGGRTSSGFFQSEIVVCFKKEGASFREVYNWAMGKKIGILKNSRNFKSKSPSTYLKINLWSSLS